MRKVIISVFVFLFWKVAVFSQITDTLICDVPDRDSVEFANLPYFANNAYLQTFLDSIGYPSPTSRIVGPDRVRFHVPVKFWVYRSSLGVGGPDIRQLQTYIDNLNRLYNIDNNTLIGFYLKCSIGYIDDDSHLVINNDIEGMSLVQQHKEAGCINIHISNTLNGNAAGVQYRARFFGVDGIFLSSATYSRVDLFSTIAHEVGHYFELDHTHQYNNRGKCRKEPIDRSRNWPFITFCPLGGGGPKS